MIISHKLQVIFIQPYKISGTSFKEALKSYCDKGDVVAKRRVHKPEFVTHYNSYDFVDDHISASQIKHRIPKNIWDNYLKVSFVRDIYDTIISLYLYHHNHPVCKNRLYEKNFNKYFVKVGSRHIEENFSNLCIDRRCVIDFIIEYENRDEDIKTLEKKIGCCGLLKTYKSKKSNRRCRPLGQDVFKVYSQYPVTRALIDMYCSRIMNDNELIQKYYPLYKERLSQKIPEPGYLSRVKARLLFALHGYWSRRKPEWEKRTNSCRMPSLQHEVKLV